MTFGHIFERKLDQALDFANQLVNLEGDQGYVGQHMLAFVHLLMKQYTEAARAITLSAYRAPSTIDIQPNISCYMDSVRERILGTHVFEKSAGLKILCTTKGSVVCYETQHKIYST